MYAPFCIFRAKMSIIRQKRIAFTEEVCYCIIARLCPHAGAVISIEKGNAYGAERI